ncbi:MAG: membrane protein insertion efficiency factor YidD [Candidatus Pacebacteria bacterium]|nr:membrane protein insertion efficiency factor YidD [Candidatus Paceibacterota bacterium]
MKKIFLNTITFYQKFISPVLGKNCRFYPSCSNYALVAMEKYGLLKGMILATKRLLKCHPLHSGGIDLP